ncbi:excisionase family DNA-binding protein [Cytobacillus sp. FJAT-53684]|uniref:Excisionase family DNA-binding protein n=1 Tax=Cytobacillus mangrovibacter TaxID=3299024 RepID=A0ABW6JX48_9BACI
MGMMMNEEVIFNRFINVEFPFQEKKNNYKELEISLTEIFTFSCMMIQMRYPNYLYRVIPSEDAIYKEANEISGSMIKALKEFSLYFSHSKEVTPLNFGRVKYYFDTFFFSITEKGKLNYLYADDYLLTVDEAGKELNVSRPTINKYGQNGQIELLQTSKHRKIPKHAVEIWRDTDLLVKVQVLHGLYMKRNSFLHQQLEEILVKIKEFEELYDNQPFEVVYKDVINGGIPWDAVDSVGDYSEWELLIEERDEIKEQLGIHL